MNTVVWFVKMRDEGRKKNAGKNRIYSRTLRKISFIDNRYLNVDDDLLPKPSEHWLVDIIRENQNSRGGCFILKPIKKLDDGDLAPLIHGMYEMRQDGDAVILVPNDNTKYWILSPTAKQSIQEAYGDEVNALVIDHGLGMWQRRKPPEDLIEDQAARLLKDIQSDGDS